MKLGVDDWWSQSKFSQQNQNQNNYDDKAESSATVIAGPVEGAASDAAKAT